MSCDCTSQYNAIIKHRTSNIVHRTQVTNNNPKTYNLDLESFFFLSFPPRLFSFIRSFSSDTRPHVQPQKPKAKDQGPKKSTSAPPPHPHHPPNPSSHPASERTQEPSDQVSPALPLHHHKPQIRKESHRKWREKKKRNVRVADQKYTTSPASTTTNAGKYSQ